MFFFDSESIDTLNDAGDHDDIIDLRAIDGNLVEDGHQPLTFDQIELTEEAIIITLITGGESAFALDQGATMRINENGGEYALADIQLI